MALKLKECTGLALLRGRMQQSHIWSTAFSTRCHSAYPSERPPDRLCVLFRVSRNPWQFRRRQVLISCPVVPWGFPVRTMFRDTAHTNWLKFADGKYHIPIRKMNFLQQSRFFLFSLPELYPDAEVTEIFATEMA